MSVGGASGNGTTTLGGGPCAVNCTNDWEIYAMHPGGANGLFADGSVRFLAPPCRSRSSVPSAAEPAAKRRAPSDGTEESGLPGEPGHRPPHATSEAAVYETDWMISSATTVWGLMLP